MPDSHSLSVSRYADLIVARRTAKQMAMEIGFDPASQEQIVLVVSELTSNLIKYAGRGVIDLQAISEAGRAGIRIASHDRGPGFDSGQALADGFSSSGTLGIGLGAVRRMVDAMDIDTRQTEPTGADIVCKKWLAGPGLSAPHLSGCPQDIGAVSRAKPGYEINGDAYLIKPDPLGNCLIAVIDGVGHGFPAHKAAQAARQFIESHAALAMPELFRGVEQACQGSSGVVMALAYFDRAAEMLTFASIGNIEAKIVGGGEKNSLLVRRGILGRHAPAPIVCKQGYASGFGLVMHSDGVSSRWSWPEFAHFSDKPAQFVAEQMQRKLAKQNDDATLIFVKIP